MPNTELLKKTLTYIKDNPEQWEQDWWVTAADDRETPGCGTAYCFAGHTVVLSGCKVSAEAEVVFSDLPEQAQARIHQNDVYQSDYSDLLVVGVAQAASALLGITSFYTLEPHLFDADNKLADLERFVAELCGETTPDGAS